MVNYRSDSILNKRTYEHFSKIIKYCDVTTNTLVFTLVPWIGSASSSSRNNMWKYNSNNRRCMLALNIYKFYRKSRSCLIDHRISI